MSLRCTTSARPSSSETKRASVSSKGPQKPPSPRRIATRASPSTGSCPPISLTPTERSSSMAVSNPTTTPATIEMRRSRLVGLLAVVAVAAAAISWAVSAVTIDGDSGPALKVVYARSAHPERSELHEVDQRNGAGAAGRRHRARRPSRRTRRQQLCRRRARPAVQAIRPEHQRARAGTAEAAVLTALGLDARDRQYLMELTSSTSVGPVAAGH